LKFPCLKPKTTSLHDWLSLIRLCLDVCIGARYWIFGGFQARIPGLELFGWPRYSTGAFDLNIELPIFCLGSLFPNVLGESSTFACIRSEAFSPAPSYLLRDFMTETTERERAGTLPPPLHPPPPPSMRRDAAVSLLLSSLLFPRPSRSSRPAQVRPPPHISSWTAALSFPQVRPVDLAMAVGRGRPG
jgi:hypothetical protein